MNRGGRGSYARSGYNNRFSSRDRGRGGSRGASRSAGPKGVFADGIWHCDCTPRLPAEHFKVKKEGKNQGRWFYTCQNQEPQRCGFFLWDDDAKFREEGAVLSNSRSEPESRQVPPAQEGWNAGRSRSGGMFAGVDPIGKGSANETPKIDDESTEDESPPPAYSSQRQNGSSTKRKADIAELDNNNDSEDDELLPWPLTGQEEQELIDAADSAAPPPPETPRKVAKTGVYATPATTVEKKRTLPWLQEPNAAIVTPTTRSAVNLRGDKYLDSPSKQPDHVLPHLAEQDFPPTPILQSGMSVNQYETPSVQGRYRNALANPADNASSLTSESLAALSAVNIPPEILATLREILSKHDLKAQGVVKGRGISRLALKAKEARVVELQARIASLEAERELDRGVIRTLRWEGEHAARGVLDKG